jgi:hypothetical protein
MATPTFKKYMVGYRPAVSAHEGLMLGIRQPLDGPIFVNGGCANWCIYAMISHYGRRLSMSDAWVEPSQAR